MLDLWLLFCFAFIRFFEVLRVLGTLGFIWMLVIYGSFFLKNLIRQARSIPMHVLKLNEI